MSDGLGFLVGASDGWWAYVFHATWQAAFLGVVLLGAAWLLRRRSLALLVLGVVALPGLRTVGAQESAGANSVHIKAFIDGESVISMRGGELWYEHRTYDLPGKWWDRLEDIRHDEATYVNGVAWKPEWRGNVSKPFGLSGVALAREAETRVRATTLEGRGQVAIIATPAPGNDYTLSVVLNDVPYEAAWYEILIEWGPGIAPREAAAGASTAAASPPQAVPALEDIPGTVVFHGRYHHRSRGGDITEPGELWLKQQPDGSLAAITRLPFLDSMFITIGDNDHRVIRYTDVREGTADRPGYSNVLDIRDAEVLVSRRGIREDLDAKPLVVPAGALFDPNQRPDPYCAANLLLRHLHLGKGESRELDVYDWDNSGEGLAAYRIRIEHRGTEEVTLPPGTFIASHLVLTQLTSADTWFKKRAGHTTEFWVLDNGVIVRILRHREPYELELLDWDTPETLPGLKESGKAAAGLKAPEIPGLNFEALPGMLTFEGMYAHRCGDKTYAEPGRLWLKQAEDGAVTAVARLGFAATTYVAQGDSEQHVMQYQILRQSPEGTVESTRTFAFRGGEATMSEGTPGAEQQVWTATAPPDALFHPGTVPDPYCALNIISRTFHMQDSENRPVQLFDVDESGEGLAVYSVNVEHAGQEEITVPAGRFRSDHARVTRLDPGTAAATEDITDIWILSNNIVLRVLRHRDDYEMVLQDYASTEELPGVLGPKPFAHGGAAVRIPDRAPTLEIDVLGDVPGSPRSMWQDTGLVIQQGDEIVIEGKGLIVWHTGLPGAAQKPEGYDYTYTGSGPAPLLPQIAFMALVGRVGEELLDDGMDTSKTGIYGPGYVGARFRTVKTSPGPGKLELGINDGGDDGNLGDFIVKVWVVRGGRIPPVDPARRQVP